MMVTAIKEIQQSRSWAPEAAWSGSTLFAKALKGIDMVERGNIHKIKAVSQLLSTEIQKQVHSDCVETEVTETLQTMKT